MSNVPNGRDLLPALCLGALLGGAVAFLCFTRSGRQLIGRVDHSLDLACEQMQRLRATAEKVRQAIEEGRRTLGVVEELTDPFANERVDRVRH